MLHQKLFYAKPVFEHASTVRDIIAEFKILCIMPRNLAVKNRNFGEKNLNSDKKISAEKL